MLDRYRNKSQKSKLQINRIHHYKIIWVQGVTHISICSSRTIPMHIATSILT